MNTNGHGNELATTTQQRVSGLTPASMREAFDLARAAAVSKMFGMETPEQALMCLMRGMELGFGPATSLSAFHVIKGKPCLSASAQVALCKSRKDLCLYFSLVSNTDKEATYETHRVGDPAPIRMSFTWADAVAAQLVNQPSQMWQKYPKNMLRSRAATQLARDVYPELLMGIYDPEEMESTEVREPMRAEVTQEPTHAALDAHAADHAAVFADNIAHYAALMGECATMSDLAKLAGEIKREPAEVQKALRGPYATRRAALAPKPPTNGGGAPKPEAPAAIEVEATPVDGGRVGAEMAQAVVDSIDPLRGLALDREEWDAGTHTPRTWLAHLALYDAPQAVANSWAKNRPSFGRNTSAFRMVAAQAIERLGMSTADAGALLDKACKTKEAKDAAAATERAA